MGAGSDVAIRVAGLTKSYGGFTALRGIDLEVRRGASGPCGPGWASSSRSARSSRT